MKHMKSYKNRNNNALSDEIIDSIIRVAYGDASLFEKYKIYRLAKSNEKVNRVLKEYKETAHSVHSISHDECPPELVKKVVEAKNISQSTKPSLIYDFYTAIFVKPAITMAVIVVLISAIIVSVSYNSNGYYNDYEAREIELANQQAKFAFNIISKVFTETSNSLTDNIISERVSKPINEGIKTVNKLFIEKEVKK